MADEDEEVVFENSALHQHLMNVGFEEDEVHPEKRNLQQELEDPETPLITDEQTHEDEAIKPCTKPRTSILNCFQEKLHTARRQAEYQCGRQFYMNLLSNSALEAEDKSFLISFIEGEEDEDFEEPVQEKHWEIWLVSAVVLLVSYLIPRVLFSWPVPALVTDVLVILLVVFAITPFSFLVEKYYEIRCQRHIKSINKTVDYLKALKNSSKKSVRLIQEMELVARGFTLVNHSAPLPWLEKGSGSQRQCIDLRKVLFNTCRSVLLLSRQTTLKLIQKNQVVGEMLEGGSYLAHIPLEQYGALVVGQSEEAVQLATDNYSISAIKAMMQLQNWYASEMLKRLALGLLLLPKEKSDNSVLAISEEAITEISEDVKENLHDLKLCHKIHHCAVSETTLESAKSSSFYQKSHMSNVYTAVHSLSLHLQATLRKVQKMEEKLEPLCPDDEGSHQICKTLQEAIASEFVQLQLDLESCKDCVEEGISRLEKKEYPPKPESLDSLPTEPEPTEQTNSAMAIPLFHQSEHAIGDPIIEDQVFEAYTDPNEMEDDNLDLELLFSEEERERRKRERKNAKRVIRELNVMMEIKSWQKEKEKKQEAGEEVEEEPPKPVAVEEEDDEEEEETVKKKNPYSETLLEYERQWREMDTVLHQDKCAKNNSVTRRTHMDSQDDSVTRQTHVDQEVNSVTRRSNVDQQDNSVTQGSYVDQQYNSVTRRSNVNQQDISVMQHSYVDQQDNSVTRCSNVDQQDNSVTQSAYSDQRDDSVTQRAYVEQQNNNGALSATSVSARTQSGHAESISDTIGVTVVQENSGCHDTSLDCSSSEHITDNRPLNDWPTEINKQTTKSRVGSSTEQSNELEIVSTIGQTIKSSMKTKDFRLDQQETGEATGHTSHSCISPGSDSSVDLKSFVQVDEASLVTDLMEDMTPPESVVPLHDNTSEASFKNTSRDRDALFRFVEDEPPVSPTRARCCVNKRLATGDGANWVHDRDMDINLTRNNSERSETSDSENLSFLKQKLEHIPGVGFGFGANVAALASQRSQKFGLVTDTFGDSDEDEISET